MVTVAHRIDGAEALTRIDASVSRLRDLVHEAVAEADEAKAEEVQIREAQLQCFERLASLRLDLIEDPSVAQALDDVHAQARALLQKHQDHIATEDQALRQAEAKITQLETERQELANKRQSAIDVYETKVADVQKALEADAQYQKLVDVHDEAVAVVSRVEQKLEVAQTEKVEKSKPYLSDPLFSYLWRRGFRSKDYKASPPIRFLDQWVGRLCKYDQAYLDYVHLTELPERLARHLERVEEKAETAKAALETYEHNAVEQAGGDALREAVDQLAQGLKSTDQQIEAAEIKHQELTIRHQHSLSAQSGPAAEARELLSDRLKSMSFPDLRELVAETVELADDEIVDELVKLRARELNIEQEASRHPERIEHLRQSLGALEAFRRKFKASKFDSRYVLVGSAYVDEAIENVARGNDNADGAVRRLRKKLRWVNAEGPTGFGGRRRRSTMGLPELATDILIASVLRSGYRGPTRGRTMSRPSAPRSRPRRSGGFRTGGGF